MDRSYHAHREPRTTQQSHFDLTNTQKKKQLGVIEWTQIRDCGFVQKKATLNSQSQKFNQKQLYKKLTGRRLPTENLSLKAPKIEKSSQSKVHKKQIKKEGQTTFRNKSNSSNPILNNKGKIHVQRSKRREDYSLDYRLALPIQFCIVANTLH